MHPILFLKTFGVPLRLLSQSPSKCEALFGFSSLQECHRVVLAESICHPRRAIYGSFLLLAPVLILVFAYI